MRILGLTLVLLVFAGLARGDGIRNPGTQFVGNMGEGPSNSGGGVAPPPNPCTGAADFSDGCAMALFGL